MPTVRPLLGTALVTALCGCAVGELSPRTIVRLDAPVALTGGALEIGPTTGIPRAQIGSRCAPNVGAVAGPATSSSVTPFFAVRPGVGSRVTMSTWSAGSLHAELPFGNTHPPSLTPITIALRLVGAGQHLDPAERAVLATFLTANRTEWSSLSGPTNDYPVAADMRRALVAELESHQAALWNGLVRSLCIEVRGTAPPGVSTKVPAIRAIANMAALCAALPATSRRAFVATFIDVRAAQDNPACASWVVNRSLDGVGLLVDSAAWPAAVLAVTSKGGDNDYYDSGTLGSPKTLLGILEVNAVRPLHSGAPPWSLEAWEASGICRPDEQDARIDAVLLRGARTFLYVEDENPTYRVVDRHVAREMERIKGSNPFKFSIARSDLKLLTAADVRALRWKAGEQDISLPGCDQAER